MNEEIYISILDKHLVLYPIRSPEILKAREIQKTECVMWAIKMLNEPIYPCGTVAELPDRFAMFGSEVWFAIRECVLARDGKRCRICGAPATEVHHIKPKQLHGSNHPRNLISVCTKCHDEIHHLIDDGIDRALMTAIFRGNMITETNLGNYLKEEK